MSCPLLWLICRAIFTVRKSLWWGIGKNFRQSLPIQWEIITRCTPCVLIQHLTMTIMACAQVRCCRFGTLICSARVIYWKMTYLSHWFIKPHLIFSRMLSGKWSSLYRWNTAVKQCPKYSTSHSKLLSVASVIVYRKQEHAAVKTCCGFVVRKAGIRMFLQGF